MAATLARWFVRLLAATAFGLSVFLWWTSATTQSAVGCNAFAGFDCDAALASPWAKWLGLPVAAGGTLCYAAALAGSFLAGRRGAASAIGWRLLELAAPLAVGAGLWFTGVQIAALDSFCVYCLATHACGLAMAIAILVWRASASSEERPTVGVSPITPAVAAPTAVEGPPSLGLPTVAGLLGVIVLAAGQTMFAAPNVSEYQAELSEQFNLGDTGAAEVAAIDTDDTSDEGVSAERSAEEATSEEPSKPSKPARRRDGSRKLSLFNGRLNFDTYEQAVLGSPDAPHIVIEMMDYACPHCREFHDKLTEALERFDGQIAVVVMPVPGEIVCNPHVQKARKQSVGACFAAKLSLAVSKLAPEEFEKFHEWMLEDDTIPSRGSSLNEARRHVDGNELSRALQDEDGVLAARIKSYVELAAAIGRKGRFGLPAQILGDKVIAGPLDSVDTLCTTWAEAFGLETPTAEIPF